MGTPLGMNAKKFTALTFGVVAVAAAGAGAHLHLMQIEQVIGGIGGDTAAQAIQLRLRADGENFISDGRIRVWDASGQNPIMVIDFTADVPVDTAGSRVLIATPSFISATSPNAVPDFLMTNPIPDSYMAAGRLTFESDAGDIFWSLAWGGAAYTGPTTGDTFNDVDGDFGPAFATPLPTEGVSGLRFLRAANARSISNSTDYALTPGAAVFTNNAGASFTVTAPPSCEADFDGDGFLTGLDFDGYVAAFEAGEASADFDGDGFITGLDFDAYVAAFEAGC